MLDPVGLSELVAMHGPCVRVVTAEVKGSGPREVGSAMVIWPDGQMGTIGGGALEHEATRAARHMLAKGRRAAVTRHPLGPALGQCCGGHVTLVSERIDASFLKDLDQRTCYARRVEGAAETPLAMQHEMPHEIPCEMPLAIKRQLNDARAQGVLAQPSLIQGWWIEPVQAANQPLWIWGAGHVGRALVDVIAPLTEMKISWIDIAATRFPETVPGNVDVLYAERPEELVKHAPKEASHLIVTYSHSLDLALCHGLLQHDARFIGLIGSATKWVRFQKRLTDLGHSSAAISRITCPIGDPNLGKSPQAIAIGVAAKLLNTQQEQTIRRTATA